MKSVAVVILAAGKGTRMKSDLAKVLHEISGVPMIRYVVETALCLVDDVVVVIGHQAEAVRRVLEPFPTLRFAEQTEQLGTGHAALTALPQLHEKITDVVILCGDTPLIRPKTLRDLIEMHRAGSRPLTLVASRLEDPFGYGRIVCNADGHVVSIVEESDATQLEKRIDLVNTGTYCISIDFLNACLPHLTCDNSQAEFYLTDVVGRAYEEGMGAMMVEADDALEVLGVNTKDDLALAERILDARMKGRA